ncbi:MAG: amino acid ABC transporter permease [Chitinophagales bacterium]
MGDGATVIGLINFVSNLMQSRIMEIFRDYSPMLLIGVIATIKVTTLAVGLGLIIGMFAGMGRLSRVKFISGLSVAYIEFFRGTPLLVQVFLIYFGVLPLIFGHSVNEFLAAVIACSINSGAYIAEIVRGGIQSIDRGQLEAAKSLGMSYRQAMRHIILPQAFKVMIPPLINEFIAMLKDTSLVSVIAVEELTRKGQLAIAINYEPFIMWSMVAVLYLVMTLAISRLGIAVERRLKTE